MHRQVLPREGPHAVQQSDTLPAIVVLSSSLAVLYGNRGGTAVLRELKGTGDEVFLQIPAPVIACLADGILKNIDTRRMLRDYAPFSISCSIQGPARLWYCQAFGLPSRDKIERSRIVLLFSDQPRRAGTAEQGTRHLRVRSPRLRAGTESKQLHARHARPHSPQVRKVSGRRGAS